MKPPAHAINRDPAQKIYLLCGGSPKEVMCATTRLRSLREALETCIHQRRIAYYGDPSKTITIPDQIRSLRADELTENILGGEVRTVENGQVI